MDYKEKYEMALEGIQEILGSGEDSIKMSRLQLRLQGIFPELKESEDERIRKAIHIYLDWLDGKKDYAPRGEYTINDMIDWIEKQGKHQKFRDSIQVGDKVTRNEDGVLVNLSQLNRVAKKDEKQGENNMGISEATKQKLENNLNKALEKETPESWNEFLDDKVEPKFKVGDIIRHKEQGFTCKITAVDTEYSVSDCCGTHLPFDRQDAYELVEQKPTVEMKTPEESLGIDSDTYNKIVDECVYGEQKSTDKIESRQEKLTEFEKAVKQVMEEAIECGDTHNLKADADMLLRLVQKPAYTKEYDFYGIKFIPKFAKEDVIKDKKSGEVSTIKDFSYDTGLYTHTYGQFPITIQDNYEIIAQNSFWSKEDGEMSRFIGNAITVDDASIYLESKGIQVIDAHVWLNELKYRVQPQPKQEWSDYDECMLANLIDDPHCSIDSEYVHWLKSLRERYSWKPSDEQMNNK